MAGNTEREKDEAIQNKPCLEGEEDSGGGMR